MVRRQSVTPPKSQFFTPPGWTPEITLFRDDRIVVERRRPRHDLSAAGHAVRVQRHDTTASLGNKVVDVSVVHNMRGRDVVFAADGSSPAQTFYAFFDGTAIQPYIQQANILQLATLDASNVKPFFVGQTVYVQKATLGHGCDHERQRHDDRHRFGLAVRTRCRAVRPLLSRRQHVRRLHQQR
jgi:hypothetical protein